MGGGVRALPRTDADERFITCGVQDFLGGGPHVTIRNEQGMAKEHQVP